jgi:hypothetical protein
MFKFSTRPTKLSSTARNTTASTSLLTARFETPFPAMSQRSTTCTTANGHTVSTRTTTSPRCDCRLFPGPSSQECTPMTYWPVPAAAPASIARLGALEPPRCSTTSGPVPSHRPRAPRPSTAFPPHSPPGSAPNRTDLHHTRLSSKPQLKPLR